MHTTRVLVRTVFVGIAVFFPTALLGMTRVADEAALPIPFETVQEPRRARVIVGIIRDAEHGVVRLPRSGVIAGLST